MPVARLACLAVVAATAVLPAPRGLRAQSAAGAPPATTAQSVDPVPVREWAVPWKDSRPRDPVADAAGKVWFVGQAGNYVATLDPATGQFRRYAIDPGTHPHNVVVAPDGQAWYAGNRNAMIGRIEPATGRLARFPMPDSAAKDPHTMLFAPDGDLWFTVQFGGYVGRLTPRTGAVRLVKIPTPTPPTGTPASNPAGDARAYAPRPYGLALDSRGRPWVDLFGTNAIATVDPATMRLRTYALPHDRARPRRIAVTSDDMVWYVDYTRGFLGRLDPRSGAVKEWANPAGGRSLPYAMATDDQDRLWYVETGVQPNRLVGFDPRTERVFSVTPIASGGGTVRHMTFDRSTGQLWFGTDVGTIGRATVGGAKRPLSD